MNKRAMAFLVLGVVIVAAAAAAVLNWNSERGRGDSVAGVSRADSALHDGAGDADSDASRASMQNGKTASEAVIPGADASFPGQTAGAHLQGKPLAEANADSIVPSANKDDGEAISPAMQAIFGKGPVQPVRGDANPQVASIVEAARTGQHPERLTAWRIPASFDEAKYRQDPQAYLNVVEPGRVYATAEPANDMPVLRPAGSRFFHIKQGESVELAVKIPSASGAGGETSGGWPVTFTSFDMGAFENGVTSMTVAADDKGVARVRFVAVAGTIADVSILAGSPVASGQVKFMVSIESPVADAAASGEGL